MDRKAYTRKDGRRVPKTSYCTPGSGESRGRKTRGAPHSGGKPWITRKGKLGGAGYMKKSWAQRKKLLDACVDEWGYRSCLGSVIVLMRNRAVYAKHKKLLDHDKDYLVEAYGGVGAFGPRRQRRRAA